MIPAEQACPTKHPPGGDTIFNLREVGSSALPGNASLREVFGVCLKKFIFRVDFATSRSTQRLEPRSGRSRWSEKLGSQPKLIRKSNDAIHDDS